MKKRLTKTDKAMIEMARAYGFGTSESRAIMTAVEHARITR